jgi:hypothetical protein
MARDYVRFAWEERPPFETLYGAGLDKNRYPELKRAYEPIDVSVVRNRGLRRRRHGKGRPGHCPRPRRVARRREYGGGPDAVRTAADRVVAATRAVIKRRKTLHGKRR